MSSAVPVRPSGVVAMTRSRSAGSNCPSSGQAIAPGAIAWQEDGQFAAEERERIVRTTPLARTGAPEDIAQAVHFLACAPYVTGQIVAVDGGRSIFL